MNNNGTSGSKRAATQSDAIEQQQQRQKREKYTQVACNECKKRKIKCSGESTCRRCKNLELQCVYKSTFPSVVEEKETSARLNDLEAKYADLQEQIQQIQSSVLPFQSGHQTNLPLPLPLHTGTLGLQSVSPSRDDVSIQLHQRQRKHTDAQFVGATSATYSFDVGKSSLKIMGVQPDNGAEVTLDTPGDSPTPQTQELPPTLDPLQYIPLSRALHLIDVYETELHPIYPFLDLSRVVSHVHLLHNKYQGMTHSGEHPETSSFDNQDSDVLKMVLAKGLIVEGLGQSDLAEQLVDSVDAARNKRLRRSQADLREVLIVTMMSVYHFHCDEEILAWRSIGSAARLAFEMGLHRKDTLLRHFPDPEQRSWAIKLFWCVYVLDRRWSFGTGMPFAMHPTDLDSELPEPGDSSPYLQCLVSYGRISSAVWSAVNDSSNTSTKSQKTDSGYLDFQIQQWRHAIPQELQLIHPSQEESSASQPRSLHLLRTLLYIRANHMRILIYRHNLLSATSIAENLEDAKTAVSIAKDTIDVLVNINSTSTIYQTQQNAFNYFLISALAALFLAVCHGPDYFSQLCRTEFYSALDLMKSFPSKSLSTRRLWRISKYLKSIGPKLGLTPVSGNTLDAVVGDYHPAFGGVGMSTTASSIQGQDWNLNAIWSPEQSGGWFTSDQIPNFGDQMSFALTDLFEVAVGNGDRHGQISNNPQPNMESSGDEMLFQHYNPLENNRVSQLLGNLI